MQKKKKRKKKNVLQLLHAWVGQLLQLGPTDRKVMGLSGLVIVIQERSAGVTVFHIIHFSKEQYDS